MSRIALFSIVALFAGAALAGCTGDGGQTTTTTTTTPGTTTTTTTPPTTPTPDENQTLSPDAYHLETRGVPSEVIAGRSFNFTLHVNGTEERFSDHVGAHYGANTTTTPSTSVYDQTCEHQEGDLPGTFTVTCQIAQPGTYHLRGHARVNESGTLVNFWSNESTVTVRAPVGEYALTTTLTSGVPATVLQDTNLTFNLTISGEKNDTSDHIGGHWGPDSTDEPSVQAYPSACAHVSGDVPGTYTIRCLFEEPGTYHLRGHLRITAAGEAHNFWTADEYTVVVTPV